MSRLTEVAARQAKPCARPVKLYDEDGLYLLILPSSRKSWRVRREHEGAEKVVTLGRYPAMSLAQARGARDALRDRPAASGVTLREASEAWLARQAPLWKPHHAADVRHGLAADIWPDLGHMRLSDITAPALLAVLRAVQARGAVETAHRLRQRVAAVYAAARAAGEVVIDPAAGLEAALTPIVRQGRQPAVLTLADARRVLAAVEATPAHPVILLAHRLLALTVLRPGEVRFGRWSEIEGDVWTIPAARMKHKRSELAGLHDHVVPLATQAVEALDALRRVSRGEWLFPSWSDARRPITDNALVYLLNRAGLSGRHVPHGWRATFSTVANEADPANGPIVELMLAHVARDQVRAAYDRARHMERRRALAQWWADALLDGARTAAELLEGRRK